jgi:hypothetical protein
LFSVVPILTVPPFQRFIIHLHVVTVSYILVFLITYGISVISVTVCVDSEWSKGLSICQKLEQVLYQESLANKCGRVSYSVLPDMRKAFASFDFSRCERPLLLLTFFRPFPLVLLIKVVMSWKRVSNLKTSVVSVPANSCGR